MKSLDAVTKSAESPSSVVWGKNASVVALGALVLACSITVGCSGDKPKAANASSQIPLTPPQTVASNMPLSVPEAVKPATTKVVKKRPVTKTYADKTYGVSFEYPRKYEMETGDKAKDLLASGPMKSALDGGVTVAAVELPETVFPNTDFAGAFFGISVNKELSAEQCGEFGEKKSAEASPAPAVAPSDTPSDKSVDGSVQGQPSVAEHSVEGLSIEDQGKRMLGDGELHATETVTGEGSRQSDAKYFRTFQNGACYEFALNVTTVGNDDATMKHVDRDRVFDRLEKILGTVKIAPSLAEPVPATQTTASIPAAPAVAETPAQ